MRKLIYFSLAILSVGRLAFASSLDERVRQVEQKFSQLDATEIQRNSKLAEAMAALERLQAQVQSLGGGSEAQTVQLQQFKESMERMYRDLEMRFGTMEGQLKLFQSELSRALAKVAPGLEKERVQFQKALDLVQSGQYAKAVEAFQQFLTKYPKSPSQADALFWIGECRYALRDFSQAIKDYQKFIERFPKSDKAPAAILKQGDAFLNLGMKEEAKIFWNKLLKEHPNSVEAQQGKSKLESPAAPSPVTPSPVSPTPPSSVQIPPAPSPKTNSPSEEF